MLSIYPDAPYAHELAQYEMDSRALRQYRIRRALRLGLACAAILSLWSMLFAVHVSALLHIALV